MNRAMLIHVCRFIAYRRRHFSPQICLRDSKILMGTGDEFSAKVKRVLETNIADDEYNIKQLCRELAISHSQLYRKFRSVSKKSLAEYFKSLRLRKAKTLLSTTSMNVTEVAFASGFKNLSYFSREFAHHFGRSPRKFRLSVSRKNIFQKSKFWD